MNQITIDQMIQYAQLRIADPNSSPGDAVVIKHKTVGLITESEVLTAILELLQETKRRYPNTVFRSESKSTWSVSSLILEPSIPTYFENDAIGNAIRERLSLSDQLIVLQEQLPSIDAALQPYHVAKIEEAQRQLHEVANRLFRLKQDVKVGLQKHLSSVDWELESNNLSPVKLSELKALRERIVEKLAVVDEELKLAQPKTS